MLCATLFVLKSGMETERGGLSEATSRGNFSVKCPFPLFPPSASSIPLFLPTFECSLSFRAHNHSTVAGRPWSNILRFPGEGLWAITRFSREKGPFVGGLHRCCRCNVHCHPTCMAAILALDWNSNAPFEFSNFQIEDDIPGFRVK